MRVANLLKYLSKKLSNSFKLYKISPYLLKTAKKSIKAEKTSKKHVQNLKKIGYIIYKKRVLKRWPQNLLAQMTGFKQPDISAIEKGKKNITLGTLFRLCDVLEIDLFSHL